MAGINRLGKGPAKPGTMRPADPNKYKTMDIFSEGTEGDKDYARMVQDIEDTQQNHSGWLFGRGAFDKGDLLYLRDEEEKRRFAEQELRESELRSFARMRQKTEALRDDDDPGPDAQADKNKGGRSQSEIVRSLLRVKTAPKVKLKQEANIGSAQKRVKIEHPAFLVKNEPEIKIESGEDNGLAGLLGGYSSDSDDEDTVVVKAEPLIETYIKREATVEAPTQAKEEAPPWKEDGEEVDYSDSDDSSS